MPTLAGDDMISAALLNIASGAASAMEQEICATQGLISGIDWWTDLDVSIAYAQEEAWNMLGTISASIP